MEAGRPARLDGRDARLPFWKFYERRRNERDEARADISNIRHMHFVASLRRTVYRG